VRDLLTEPLTNQLTPSVGEVLSARYQMSETETETESKLASSQEDSAQRREAILDAWESVIHGPASPPDHLDAETLNRTAVPTSMIVKKIKEIGERQAALGKPVSRLKYMIGAVKDLEQWQQKPHAPSEATSSDDRLSEILAETAERRAQLLAEGDSDAEHALWQQGYDRWKRGG
jgi:hypothetical protein